LTNRRLAYASSAVLSFAGLFTFVRADERLQAISGLVLMLSAISIAVVTYRAADQPEA